MNSSEARGHKHLEVLGQSTVVCPRVSVYNSKSISRKQQEDRDRNQDTQCESQLCRYPATGPAQPLRFLFSHRGNTQHRVVRTQHTVYHIVPHTDKILTLQFLHYRVPDIKGARPDEFRGTCHANAVSSSKVTTSGERKKEATSGKGM